MAMGVDYSYELISIETYAHQFIGHNKVFLGRQCESLVIEQTLFFHIQKFVSRPPKPKTLTSKRLLYSPYYAVCNP